MWLLPNIFLSIKFTLRTLTHIAGRNQRPLVPSVGRLVGVLRKLGVSLRKLGKLLVLWVRKLVGKLRKRVV